MTPLIAPRARPEKPFIDACSFKAVQGYVSEKLQIYTSNSRLLVMSLIINMEYSVCKTNFMFSYLEVMWLLVV